MKEHPILFKGEMVRALLNGSKTQTRRTNLKTKYAVGDRLWVRETFHDEGDGRVFYRADNIKGLEDFKGWRPSLFMPQWASRITLEITSIREERLQDITGADAISEGVSMPDIMPQSIEHQWSTAKKIYRTLWETINGVGSFDENPLVKVISFRRVQP